MATNKPTIGLETTHHLANCIVGSMCIPRAQNDSAVVHGDDMNLGEPQRRVVAYEIPTENWLEVIYV